MTHYFYIPCFKSCLISVANGRTNKTVCKTASLISILNLRLRLFIIYNYLQQIILSKIYKNDCSLDKYYN